MVIVTLKISLPVEEPYRVIETLASLVGPTRVRKGCISCELFHNAEDSNVLLLIEEWKAMDDFERHAASKEFSKALVAMDMSSKSPELSIGTISKNNGLEFVERARIHLNDSLPSKMGS